MSFIQFLLACGLALHAASRSPIWALAFWGIALALWVIEGLWLRWSKNRHGLTLLTVAAGVAPLAVAWSSASWGFARWPGLFGAVGTIAGAAALTLVLYALQSGVAVMCGVAKIRAAVRNMAEEEARVLTIRDRAPSTGKIHWEVHPSGLRYQSSIAGEIGMGGPATSRHLFDNGVELGDGALYIGNGGRYVACTGVRYACEITLMDFETGRCVKWSDCDDAKLLRGERGPEHPRLRRRLQSPQAVQFRRAHGLWVHPEADLAPEKITLSDKAGRHRLELAAIIDDAELREMAEAARYLEQPFYRVMLDGLELPIQTASPGEIVWSEAGDRLLIPAKGVSAEGSHWLWREDSAPAWITPSWPGSLALPSANLNKVVEIDRETVCASFSVGTPSGGGYPNAWLDLRSPSSFTYGSYPDEWVRGADEYGRLDVVTLESEKTNWQVRLHWDELGLNDKLGVIETQRGQHNPRAVFEPMPARPGDRLARYRVCAGKAAAKDVHLFHLWSDCGRFLVLQPYAVGAPASFFVLDTQDGQRMDSTYSVPGLQLNSYERGQLQVQAPVGSVPRRYEFGPFEKIDRAPAPNAEGETFAIEGDWLLMESQRFRVDTEAGLIDGPLSKCVRVTKPPFPNAAFAYLYPSPHGQRWVHCFGARDEFNDDYERGQESRYAACAITSDGVCLEGLGVAMIWSEDSRYLFFTTRLPRDHADFEDTDWEGWLLDCSTRQLHGPTKLEGLPIFDAFNATGLTWRRIDSDWWRDDLETEERFFSLQALQARPAQSLEKYGSLWLRAGAEQRSEWATLYKQSQHAALIT
jgi:hypothetical protein